MPLTIARRTWRIHAVLPLIGCALATTIGWVQTRAEAVVRPKFEVASIKPNSTNDPLYYKSYSNRFTARNMTAKLLMLLAWQIGNSQLSGGAGWFSSEGFDFEATTDRPVTWGQIDRKSVV